MGCFIATRPLILLIYYHQAANSAKKYNTDMFSSEFNETNLIMLNYGPYTKHSSILVQAVRVKIGRVCALLEEITIFSPDDQ